MIQCNIPYTIKCPKENSIEHMIKRNLSLSSLKCVMHNFKVSQVVNYPITFMTMINIMFSLWGKNGTDRINITKILPSNVGCALLRHYSTHMRKHVYCFILRLLAPDNLPNVWEFG